MDDYEDRCKADRAQVPELAEHLYNAYGRSRKWKTFNGGDMPCWHENKDEGVLNGWRAAAAEAVNLLLPDVPANH